MPAETCGTADRETERMVVMAVSEMYDIAWQAPSESPVLTRVQPLS